MTIKTLEEVQYEVGEIAEKHPDMVASCNYLDGDTPHCIVGVYLSEQGFTVQDLRNLGTTRIDGLYDSPWIPSDLFERITDEFDRDTLRFLGQVQEFQDDDIPWGEAFESAVNMY